MTKLLSGNVGRSPFPAAKTFLGLLILSYRAIAAAKSEPVVSKCCLPGQVFSVSDNFTCAYSKDSSRELYPLSRALHEDFACSETENLTVTALDDIVGSVIRAPAACLDFLYDGESIPVIFQCRPNNNNNNETIGELPEMTLSVPRLSNLRVCCAPTKIYDVQQRRCIDRKHDVNVDKYFNFLDDYLEFVTIDRGPPNCQSENHAIVDYIVNVTENVPRVRSDGSLEFVVSSKDGTITIVANEKNACLDPGDETPMDLMTLRVCTGSTFCKNNACVRKCCPEGEGYYYKGHCKKHPPNVSEEHFHSNLLNLSAERGLAESVDFLNISDYGLLVGKPCKHGMFIVSSDNSWHMNPHGHVFVPDYKLYEHHEYCVDTFYITSQKIGAFDMSVCFDAPEPTSESAIRYGVNATLELISCAFLVVTLLVYICLPVLQNLHGKTVMCHVASLIVAYATTAAVALQLADTPNYSEHDATIACKMLGYTVYSSWIAAFSWLNVMCFDIWWTFGGLGGASGGRGRAYKKRFLVYSLYAWGWPLLLTSVCMTVDYTEVLPLVFRPNVGTEICWFEQYPYHYGDVIYFHVPVTLQLITNVVFFVLTAIHCSRVKAEISRVMTTAADPRNRRFNADRTKLIMNVKLFIVMGVTWTLEVMSSVLNHYALNLTWRYELFYVGDVVNCLQGVLIFMLFVLKSKVYYALRRRLARRKGNMPASNGGTGLQDPYRVRKSASSSTIMSTFAVSTSP